MKYAEVSKGIVKRTEKREVAVFIDGISLDRAARRLNKRVDMAALVRGVSSGLQPVIARYYTIIPYEDDSRQRAFLDAVSRAGLQVVVKRLPPKGINRQINLDAEMSADIVAFALGHAKFTSNLNEEMPASRVPTGATIMPFGKRDKGTDTTEHKEEESSGEPIELNPSAKKIVTVVCPARDLAYPIGICKEIGADTVNADFGQFNTGDVLKSASKWIDLSDSETIWKED